VEQDVRAVRYDPALGIEACHFSGLSQPFPNHFHEYYVIGLMEGGSRRLLCRGQSYDLRPGDLLLFHPGDNHACAPCGGVPLEYRSFHLSPDVMAELTAEAAGCREPPAFGQNVIRDRELACCLSSLHRMVLDSPSEFEAEELLLFSLSLLLERYGQPFPHRAPECPAEVEAVRAYLDAHYAGHITLEQLCWHAGLSKSTLLRAFTRARGITPYRYLQAVRVNQAKVLLERGVPPGEAAARTGFADQSHFTKSFRSMIGLTPGAYREMFRP